MTAGANGARTIIGAALLAAVVGCAGGTARQGVSEAAGAPDKGPEVLARIGDRIITEDDLINSTPMLYAQIRSKAYDLVEAKEQAANQYLVNEMIEAESAERGLTPEEIFRIDIEEQVPQPSEEEIKSFFEINQQYSRGRTLDELRPTIIDQLRRPQLTRVQARFLRNLREKYDARVIVEPIRLNYVLPETVEMKGDESAPVTIVEFADFQCPSCKQAHPLVQQLLAEYPGKVRYAFVDFPLPNHARAIPASVAARCAADQGKFWDFADNLMVIAGNFADTDLYARARTVGLDPDAFAACYQSGQYEPVVQQHLDWGQSLGVNATPTFLINGRLVVGSKPFEQMKSLIDGELERAG